MTTTKGLPANLEQLDVKTHSLRKAILMLALRWKNLDEHLESASNLFGESLSNLESKQKDLDCNRESMVESNRELDLIRESLKLQLEELDSEKVKFHNFQQTQVENFKVKEEQLSAMLRGIEKRSVEVGSIEERLGGQKKSLELLFWKIEMEKMEFLEIKKSVGESLNAVILRERSFEDRSAELDRKAKELDSREEKVKFIQNLMLSKN